MKLPCRGTVAAYLAKQFNVPMGTDQRRIARLKSGDNSFETANDVAKLLVARIHRLIYPQDVASPGDIVEQKLPQLGYRLLANAATGFPLEIIWRDAAKFFHHHAMLADLLGEKSRGAESTRREWDTYVDSFALPVLANNLVKYQAMGAWLKIEHGSDDDGPWFLPSLDAAGNCVLPMTKALSWLRLELQVSLVRLLCPDLDELDGVRQLDRWRSGEVVPATETIERWAQAFTGDRTRFRIVFHLAAATTRAWHDLVKLRGAARATDLRDNLAKLMTTLRAEHARPRGARPDFSAHPPTVRGALTWLYNGPQSGPVSLGPNYEDLATILRCAG